jgi:16S rRNA (guanine1516-N2)-methyltransferase
MRPSGDRPAVTLAPSSVATDSALAAAYGVPTATTREPSSWQLVRDGRRLTLRGPIADGGLTVDLDLAQGPLSRRLRQARRDDPLARAVGLGKAATAPRVLDATAGLGRDAMTLAHLGCPVLAIERVPALACLVAAAIADTWLARNLSVRLGDALATLAGLTDADRPDVVLLDPMFEEHGNAQVKKDMQACRALAGPPDDPAPLFATARVAARERVVVKREASAPPLAGEPSFAVAGERVRFDVYLAPPR